MIFYFLIFSDIFFLYPYYALFGKYVKLDILASFQGLFGALSYQQLGAWTSSGGCVIPWVYEQYTLTTRPGRSNRLPRTGGSHQDQVLPVCPEINRVRRTASFIHRIPNKGNASNRRAGKP